LWLSSYLLVAAGDIGRVLSLIVAAEEASPKTTPPRVTGWPPLRHIVETRTVVAIENQRANYSARSDRPCVVRLDPNKEPAPDLLFPHNFTQGCRANQPVGRLFPINFQPYRAASGVF
jgi:hypothetical protein